MLQSRTLGIRSFCITALIILLLIPVAFAQELETPDQSATIQKLQQDVEKLKQDNAAITSLYQGLLQEARSSNQAAVDNYKRTIETADNRITTLISIMQWQLAIGGVFFAVLAFLGWTGLKSLSSALSSAKKSARRARGLSRIVYEARNLFTSAKTDLETTRSEAAQKLTSVKEIELGIQESAATVQKHSDEILGIYQEVENRSQLLVESLDRIKAAMHQFQETKDPAPLTSVLSEVTADLEQSVKNATVETIEEGEQLEESILGIKLDPEDGR